MLKNKQTIKRFNKSIKLKVLPMIETLKTYDELIIKASNLIRTLNIYPKVFEKEEHHYLYQFFDKILYTALNHLDLIIGLKYLDVSQAVGNKLETKYFARVVALSSYEILNDLNKLVGKEIRDYVITKIGENGPSEKDWSIKSLKNMKKDKIKKLKEIRNNLLGHKLEHAYQQAEMIANIDLKKIYDIGNQILKIQMDLIKNYRVLTEKI
jgi:hypothetical protein